MHLVYLGKSGGEHRSSVETDGERDGGGGERKRQIQGGADQKKKAIRLKSDGKLQRDIQKLITKRAMFISKSCRKVFAQSNLRLQEKAVS